MIYKLLVLAIFLSPSFLHAQEKLNSLKAPTSPASSILGLQPSTVLSPKSYQALETAIYSNFSGQDGNGIIPNDFALEFTPYWTKNHSLSLDEYLYPKSFIDQLARNSSFSIASTQNFILGDSTATNGLAIGYRVTFYLGNKKDKEDFQKHKDSLTKELKINTRIGAEAEGLFENKKISSKRDFLEKIKYTLTKTIYELDNLESIKDAEELVVRIIKEAILIELIDINDYDEFLNEFYSIIDGNRVGNSVFNNFKSYIRNRQGFSIDVAYASLINFPTNQFEFSIIPRQSFWITPTYRFKDKYSFLKFMGVLRYEWYNGEYYRKYFPESKAYTNGLDYGFALATELKNFSVQIELVGRSSNSEFLAGTDISGNQLYRKEKNSDFQYIGTFSYNLSDQIILTYSLGNRFEPVQNPDNTLVSILGLNLGFGTPKREDLNLNDKE